MGGEEPANLIAYSQAGSEQYNAVVGNIRKRLNLPTSNSQKLEDIIEAFRHPKE